MGTFPKRLFGWLFVLGVLGISIVLTPGCLRETNPEDIVRNFEQHKEDIYNLQAFCLARYPVDVFFNMRINDSEKIELRIIDFKKREIIERWNTQMSHPKVKKGLEYIGWTLEDLDSLYTLLSRTNCQLIRMGFRGTKFKNAIELGYKNMGFNLIVYLLFPEEIPRAQMEEMKYNTGNPVKWLDNKAGWSYVGAAWD